MSTQPTGSSEYYVVGGNLPPDAPSYAERKADHDLYQAIRKGQFCYVLNSRQMGKSSLRVRTMERLKAEGFACAEIDITRIGSDDITIDQWYAGIIRNLVSSFGLTDAFSLRSWLKAQEYLSPVQRLSEFIETVLLVQVSQPIAIFVDEIDSVISLQKQFSLDDFFALIRSCYNQRSDKPAFQRLTFTLLGVATPSDLIRDKTRTPFNIGQAIDLCGLTFEEARSLLPGIATKSEQPEAVLKAVLDWTEGQPFLTQKICRLIYHAESTVPAGTEAVWVEQLVRSRIIENWESQDVPEHLKTIRDRILRNEKLAGRLLGLYQQILQHGSVPADDSDEQMEFRLSGLVVKRQGTLTVYNRNYQEVFNDAWVKQALASLRPYSESLTGWLASDGADQSWLLWGSALEHALLWAKGKSLSLEDSDFLYACQELDRQETQKALLVERQANTILKDAEQIARRRIRGGLAGLVAISVIAAMVGVRAIQAGANLQSTKQEMAKLASEKQGLETASQDAQEKLQSADRQQQQVTKELKSARKDQEAATEQARIAGDAATKAEWVRQQAQVQARQAQVEAKRAGVEAERAQQLQQNASRAEKLAVTDAKAAKREKREAEQERERVRQGVALERQGVAFLRFPIEEFRQIERLTAAIQLVWDLRRQVSGSKSDLKDYPAISPLLVLRTAVNTVTQRSRFQGYYPSFSPNGKQVLTYSADGWQLYNLSGKKLAKFQGSDPDLSFSSPSFSPDGKLVLTDADDGSRLYDLSGKELTKFQGGYPRFSPNGKQVLTYSNDGLQLYDLSGKELAKFQGSSPSFSPDGKLVLTDADDVSQLYDLSGKELAKFQGSSPSFSPDSKLVVTSFPSNRLYDLSGKELAKFEGAYPRFSSDSKLVLTYSPDNNRLYDLLGKELAKFQGNGLPYFSPDDKLVLISVDDDNRLYDLSGKELAKFQGSSPSFSPDGKRVLTYSNDSSRLYDLPQNLSLRLQDSHTISSPDGKLVLTGSDDGWQLYNLSGKELAKFQGSFSSSFEGRYSRSGGQPRFSPNGQLVLTYFDGSSRLYNLSGKELAKFQGDFPRFSPNGQLVLVYSNDGNRLYDLSGKELAKFQGDPPSFGGGPSFSPDGKLVLTDSDDGSRLYDFSGKELVKFQGSDPSFSPDGKLVLTNSDNGIKLYDLFGKELAKFQGSYPSFSPDGKRVLTYSNDGSRLYDLSGKELAQLQEGYRSFSPDGKLLLTSSSYSYRDFNSSITEREPNGASWLYDLSGKELAKLQGDSPSFSLNGQLVLTDSGDVSQLHDLSDKKLTKFQGGSPSFSPDGKWILTTSPTEDISRIYDQKGNLLAEFVGSTFTNNEVYEKLSLGFTKDGKQLLTLTNDGSLRAWQVDKGLEQDKGMNDLLTRGCNWLKDYLTNNPSELEKLPVCQNIYHHQGRSNAKATTPASR